jgi:hypothetical protein
MDRTLRRGSADPHRETADRAGCDVTAPKKERFPTSPEDADADGQRTGGTGHEASAGNRMGAPRGGGKGGARQILWSHGPRREWSGALEQPHGAEPAILSRPPGEPSQENAEQHEADGCGAHADEPTPRR